MERERVIHDKEKVEISHGAGGKKMDELIAMMASFLDLKSPMMGGIGLEKLDDGGAIFLNEVADVVVSTDAHTIQPIFFPGGDIGKLAMTGTINDVAVMGAKPVAIAIAMVIEEGFPFTSLKRIMTSINQVSMEANVPIITGDTKVMPKGTVDQIIITTTGLGIAEKGKVITNDCIKPGDTIIVSGTIGDHGIAILSHREGLEFETELQSDLAPLNDLIDQILKVTTPHAMRDPTRGGLASCLADFASASKVGLEIYEQDVPIRNEVRAACEMLGFDPLQVSCEGKVVLAVPESDAETVLEVMKKHPLGKNAAIIGKAISDHLGTVVLETPIGGKRVLQKPLGELIPRVC